MVIQELKRKNYDAWLPLWQENCQGLISDEVTTETWRRLTNPKEQVFGLGLFDGDALLGFLHYVLHPTTGFIEPAAYMQDLFIAPAHRGHGHAKRLVWELHELGKTQKWARLYWFADNTDETVQKLYKNLGIKMDFSLLMLPTQ